MYIRYLRVYAMSNFHIYIYIYIYIYTLLLPSVPIVPIVRHPRFSFFIQSIFYTLIINSLLHPRFSFFIMSIFNSLNIYSFLHFFLLMLFFPVTISQ